MPYRSSQTVRRYRVTVEQLTTYMESPTAGELQAPRAQGEPEPKAREVEEWIEVDSINTADAATFAGALVSIAKRYEPEPKQAFRG